MNGKRGRPKAMGDKLLEMFKSMDIMVGRGYRATYEYGRSVRAMSVLAQACGEEPITALGVDIACRPKTAARFPWLMGNKVQHAVLAELHVSDDFMIALADILESVHLDHPFNAKRGRQAARNLKAIFTDADDAKAHYLRTFAESRRKKRH